MHHSAVAEWMDMLVATARAASLRNKSYRNFQVGCAVLAWDGETYRMFVGANAKPIEGGPKICAEQVAVMSAIAAGFETIVIIVMAGTPQPDDTSGIATTTLHPCFNCRTIFGAILPHDTPVTTVHNHSGPTEQHTLEAIIALHSPHT